MFLVWTMFSYRCRCSIFKKISFPNDAAFISSQSPCFLKMGGFSLKSEIFTKERFFLKDVDFCLNEVDVFSEQCFFYGPVVVTWKTLIFLLACKGFVKKYVEFLSYDVTVYVLKKDVDLLYLINVSFIKKANFVYSAEKNKTCRFFFGFEF